MALNDNAVLIPGTGRVYLAASGQAAPPDPRNPLDPWSIIGHTSREEGLTITRDSGDSEVKGTWENPALRERRDPATWAITFQLHQLDNNTLELFFGPGDVDTAGVFGVQGSAPPVERALFVRMIDGAAEAGLYVPRVSIGSDDDISVDVENFLAFPVRAQVLQVTGSNLMEWFAAGLGRPA
ncbi:hypothetical protein V5P93_000420 [Actinokineospora auranticolor]|uniref:Uncharacterized protein n=1 Tax=Actinokineospora auranticolor TaxID=155976 RepID=A0A2S6GE70_9PSEU|nr:hypothetical protein [Actinokineospora auranticolor]PPK63525.1 hypothetical protein CLV40_12752 [Actinokineospora auranticolor]